MKIEYSIVGDKIDGAAVAASVTFRMMGHQAQRFPKMCKVIDYACTIVNLEGPSTQRPESSMYARFSADGVNKGKNENGMKRCERFIATAKALWPDVEFTAARYNGAELPEELRKLIA